jgi:hypothetical protein
MKPLPWFRSGTFGWILLGAGVLAWDIAAPETLSDAFRRAHQHPASKYIVVAAWGTLTLHLFNKIPKRADPLHMITVAKKHVRPEFYMIPVAANGSPVEVTVSYN